MSKPTHLCPLKQTEAQEIASHQFGFQWESLNQIIEQIQSECQEVKDAYEKGDQRHLQEEIGDLIQATICAAVFCHFDPEETLQKSVDKFQKRYDKVVELALKDGLTNLKGKPVNELLDYWKQAKDLEIESEKK